MSKTRKIITIENQIITFDNLKIDLGEKSNLEDYYLNDKKVGHILRDKITNKIIYEAVVDRFINLENFDII